LQKKLLSIVEFEKDLACRLEQTGFIYMGARSEKSGTLGGYRKLHETQNLQKLPG